MNAECVIVDANIAFKCLITGRGDLRERFGPGGYPQLFTPRFLFVELFKHKDRLVRASGLAESELLAGLHTLLNQMTFVHEADIPMGTWTEDGRLKTGLRAR